MSLKVECVVDRGMHAEEALGGARWFEALQLALSSSHHPVRVLGPIILSQALLMVTGKPEVLESSAVGAQLIRDHLFRREALLSHQLAHWAMVPDAPGLPDHEIGTVMAPRLVAQPGLSRGASAEGIREDDRVLKRLASDLAKIGGRGVNGIAQQRHAPCAPNASRREIDDIVSQDRVLLGRLDKDRNGTRQLLTYSIASPRLPRGPACESGAALDQINAEKTKVSERLARLDYRTRNGRHSAHRSRDGRTRTDARWQDAACEENHIGCRRGSQGLSREPRPR